MCQISKIIQHGYNTVANLQWYGQMLQKFYCFIFPFLSPLSSFFIFSSLSLSGSFSLLLVSVPSLFNQSGMFTDSDDGVAPTTIARSATLDLSHARSRRSHPLPSPFCPLFTLPLSGCGVFFFFFAAIWVDLMVMVGYGDDDWWWLLVLLMGCLGWGYGCLLWNLAGFAWVCFELCFWLWWMWWLCGGVCWQMAVDCVDE